MKLESRIRINGEEISGKLSPLDALEIIEKTLEKVNAWQDLKEE